MNVPPPTYDGLLDAYKGLVLELQQKEAEAQQAAQRQRELEQACEQARRKHAAAKEGYKKFAVGGAHITHGAPRSACARTWIELHADTCVLGTLNPPPAG
jgi:hypothetical protein